ncbi:hypothetical protein LXL04_027042 [Taraxacum kok-saghyz]
MTNIKKILITLTMLLALAINLSATPIEDDDEDVFPTYEPLRGANRFLAQQPKGLMKCNKNPRLCRAKGSAGQDCCNKKCVNTSVIVEDATINARKEILAYMECATMHKKRKFFGSNANIANSNSFYFLTKCTEEVYELKLGCTKLLDQNFCTLIFSSLVNIRTLDWGYSDFLFYFDLSTN